MKSIYEKATTVFAWLGPAADDSDVAMEKIKETADMLKDLFGKDSDYLNEKAATISKVPEIFGEANPELIRAWLAVKKLLDRPWWGRTWILQEASALTVGGTHITCGTKQVSFNVLYWCLPLFRAVRSYTHHTQELSFLEHLNTQAVKRISDLQRRRHTNMSRTIFELARKHSSFQASDPRDKVYAMLSLASDVHDPGLEVSADYSQPVAKVFADLVS